MDRKRAAKFQLAHACRLASLVDVDRSVARIYRTLERTGQLDNTVLIFTSDNGWLEGEHRLEGKAVPYEEAVRVPLIVWAPRSLLGGASPPATVSEPAANIDLAPTLLKLASASPCPPHGRCRLMDGRSLVPLLEGHGDAWPQNRAILLESREGDFGICRFESVRTPGYVYTEYSRFLQGNAGACAPPSDRELYDLRADPSELRNLDGQPTGSRTGRIEARLTQRLDRLRTCEGIRGRNPAVAGHGPCE
jgi:arylsulfatase A-like enzyme